MTATPPVPVPVPADALWREAPTAGPDWYVVDFHRGTTWFGPVLFRQAIEYIAENIGCELAEVTWDDKCGSPWTTYRPDLSNTGLALRHRQDPT